MNRVYFLLIVTLVLAISAESFRHFGRAFSKKYSKVQSKQKSTYADLCSDFSYFDQKV